MRDISKQMVVFGKSNRKMDYDKPITREEIKELIESYLDDYLTKEEAKKIITKMYWKLEEEKKELWRSEKPV